MVGSMVAGHQHRLHGVGEEDEEEETVKSRSVIATAVDDIDTANKFVES